MAPYPPLRAARWWVKGALGSRRRLLVEMKWRLGDEVMAIPIYEALRAKYSHCELTVLCNYPELLEHNPNVDSVNEIARRVDRYMLLRGAERTVYRPEVYAKRAGVPTPAKVPSLYYKDWSCKDALSKKLKVKIGSISVALIS